MPIYEGQGRTREDLEQLVKYNRCAECSAKVNVFLDLKEHKTFLACTDWPRTHHEGIEREPSRYEMQGLASLNIPARREIMVEAYGEAKTNALEKYQGGGQLSYTGAVEVLKLVYPNCPEQEIIRTAMLCRDFGLHPLMKEVYLIPFKRKDGKGFDWATVIGITANRKIASARKGAFSFLDDTPRAASKAEIEKQFGPNSEEASENLISITKLRGERGNTVNGIGLWPRDKEPKGTSKGNTQRNMANIRSERQALDRLPGDAMPLKSFDVIDEAYAEEPAAAAVTITTESGDVDTGTGEIIESTVKPDEAYPEHWCDEHSCEYERKVRGSSVWYAHKHDGGWCNEKKTKATPAAEPSLDGIIDEGWLMESLGKVHWSEKTAASWLVGKYKVEPGGLKEVLISLTQKQVKEFAKEIQDRLEMA